eukprot:4440842-Pleurochrysis_carterae.AAC.1
MAWHEPIARARAGVPGYPLVCRPLCSAARTSAQIRSCALALASYKYPRLLARLVRTIPAWRGASRLMPSISNAARPPCSQVGTYHCTEVLSARSEH